MRRPLLAVALLVLALAAPALASEERPTLGEIEGEVICPTCQTTLALSSSPIAERMREFIRDRVAAGDTKTEIKDALVAQFGESVLAAPPKQGFNLLAWVLPLAGVAVAGTLVGVLAYRWSRGGRPGDGAPASREEPRLDPELERRLDEELARYDA